MSEQCEQTVLARGAGSEVRYCSDCRVFHINIGPLTVRLEASAAQDLRDTVSMALEVYKRVAEAAAASEPRLALGLH